MEFLKIAGEDYPHRREMRILPLLQEVSGFLINHPGVLEVKTGLDPFISSKGRGSIGCLNEVKREVLHFTWGNFL